jgi:hypothetical protein
METRPTLKPIRITLDGRAIARAIVDALDPMGAAARRAADAFLSMREVLDGMRDAVRRGEARRRRRARYEIREAILARRLGIAPEPWRGR